MYSANAMLSSAIVVSSVKLLLAISTLPESSMTVAAAILVQIYTTSVDTTRTDARRILKRKLLKLFQRIFWIGLNYILLTRAFSLATMVP